MVSMMKNSPATLGQALKALDNRLLYEAFCDQLLKDFRLCGLSVDEIETENIGLLQASLVLIVDGYLSTNAEPLRSLLYRIDIDEKKLVDLITGSEANRPEMISQAIIMRVLQKVWYRLRGSLD